LKSGPRDFPICFVSVLPLGGLSATPEKRKKIKIGPFSTTDLRMTHAMLGRMVALFLGIASTAGAAPVPAPAPVPPTMRLGEAVRPVAYDLQLTVIPTQDRVVGKVGITVEVTEATNFFWINASRLDLKKVTLTIGTRTVLARVSTTGRDYAGIRLPQIVQPGRALLAIDYEGTLERSDTAGLFRAHEGDDWYAYTNLEPIGARRVFPCFDEPGWKTPWKLTLDIPAADLAVANAPVIGEDSLAGGLKRVRFAATPPLPSYLLAFAVGPFEIVEGGPSGRKPTSLRYLVPRGRSAETRFAQYATPRILESIEDYVAGPYPFDKLDIVAVPVTSGFSASQGAGLIALQADFLLAKPDQDSSDFQQHYVDVTARTLTQQWFGDLVSMQWWDDAWLGESLASWMSSKLMQRFDTEWLTRLSLDQQRQDAAELDRLNSTHPIHQAIDSPEDLGSAFDVIATEKGAAVFRMLESWIGEDRFRAALRRYLADDPFGNARSEELLVALSAEAGFDQSLFGAAYHSMIDRAGAPELDVALVCPAVGKGAPRLELTQQRYAPVPRLVTPAPPAPAAAGTSWVFPACFQYGEGGDFAEQCIVVHDAHQVLQLPDGESCPDWVVANRDGTSYVVPLLKDPLPARLERAPLLPDEAVAAIGDTRILSGSRDFPLDRALAMAVRFSANRQPPVAVAALGLVESVPPAFLSSPEDRDNFARFVRVQFGPRALTLGWLPKPGERAVDGLLRQRLVPLVADRGADPILRAQADRLAHDWLAGRVSLGGMLRPILRTAAHFGSAELFEGYLAAASRATGHERRDLYQGLGAFRDPQLLGEALSLALSEGIDARDAWAVFVEAGADPVTTPSVVRFFADHYDALSQRLPDTAPAWLASQGRRLCETQVRREFGNVFADPARKTQVGPRIVAQSLEAADLCIANRDLQVQSLRSFIGGPAYRN